MSVGIIGVGGIGSAIAHHLSQIGEETILANRRGKLALAPLLAGLGDTVRAGTVMEAARADIVIVAVPWRALSAALAGLPDFGNRIVIDTTNPIGPPDFKPADLGGRTSSEVVASMLPGARVVKAFNTLRPEILAANPHHAGGRRVLFLSGDDAEARNTVAALIERMGFAAVDLGPLATGGRMQQFPGGPLPSLDLIRMG